MKLIPLTQGQFAQVDNRDYEWLMQWKWQASRDKDRGWYATRKTSQREGKQLICMHRLILGVSGEIQVDHVNGNGLDNRRRNIRIATSMQNTHNRKARRTNIYSPYKGVTWHKRSKGWEARIKVNHKPIALGYFKSEVAAAKEYDKAALYYFGEFAKTNFPLWHYNHANWAPRPARVPTSHFKGVMQRTGSKRWSATIYFHHHGGFIGYFDTERDAAEVYDLAIRCYFGDSAETNFPFPIDKPISPCVCSEIGGESYV